MLVATMREDVFIQLKRQFRTHKRACEVLGVSYSRYNEWRAGQTIPLAMQKYLELVVGNGTDNPSGCSSKTETA
jgi:hypothetical protein